MDKKTVSNSLPALSDKPLVPILEDCDMRLLLIVTLLLISLNSFGQSTPSILFDFDSEGNFIGKDSLITVYNGPNIITEKGKLAIDINGEISGLKVGVWESFNLGGERIDSGEYRISYHKYCYMNNVVKIEYYNYKYGQWTYYNYPNSIVAKGKYKLIKTQLIDNCISNDSLVFGIIDDNWYIKKEKNDEVQNHSSRYNSVCFPFRHPAIVVYQYDEKFKKVKRKVYGE